MTGKLSPKVLPSLPSCPLLLQTEKVLKMEERKTNKEEERRMMMMERTQSRRWGDEAPDSVSASFNSSTESQQNRNSSCPGNVKKYSKEIDIKLGHTHQDRSNPYKCLKRDIFTHLSYAYLDLYTNRSICWSFLDQTTINEH